MVAVTKEAPYDLTASACYGAGRKIMNAKTLRHRRFRGYGLRWKTALPLPSEPWELFGVEMGGCGSVKGET